MKVNSLPRITHYLLHEEKIPPNKFIVTTKRYRKSSTTVIVYYVSKNLTQGEVVLGRGIQGLTIQNEQFQSGVAILKENVYREHVTSDTPKLITRTIGQAESKDVPQMPNTKRMQREMDQDASIYGGDVRSLDALDNLINLPKDQL